MVLPRLHFLYDISYCNSSNSCILQPSGDQYGKENQRLKAVLAWIHLIGMNVGGTAITLTMIFAGLTGSGILGVITSGGGASAVSKLMPNNAIMVQFIPPRTSFAAILSIGIIAGDVTYIATYLQKNRSEYI